MIISCPECAGPFEVRDGQIAELVQVECPHCSFRMILDFAAANDPGLVEEGMKMASGFRSASDYRAHQRGEARVGAPAVTPASAAPTPAVAPVEPAAEADLPDAPRRARPDTKTLLDGPPPATSEPAVAPETPRDEHVDVDGAEDEIEVEVSSPALEVHAPEPAATPEPAAAIDTDDEDDVDTSPEVNVAELAAKAAATAAAAAVAAKAASPAEDVEAEPDSTPSGRRPPHTPPGPTKPSQPTESEDEIATISKRKKPRPRLEGFDTPDAVEGPKMSTFGVVVVVLLLLMAGGLVAASLALENTPDPRPLLEKLYRQQVKGEAPQ